ncbi:MAG TPA: hypothetical protein VEX13_17025 [Chloroflexia bacterium]|nr:hypothetical protein [Chloroflexia bacterium]
MTHKQDPEAPASGDESEGMVRLEVMMRPEYFVLMKGFAAREGASVEALASLWLEEKLDEAVRSRASRSQT